MHGDETEILQMYAFAFFLFFSLLFFLMSSETWVAASATAWTPFSLAFWYPSASSEEGIIRLIQPDRTPFSAWWPHHHHESHQPLRSNSLKQVLSGRISPWVPKAYGSCRAVLVDTALQTSHRILGWCLSTGRLGWRFLSLGLGTRRCTPVTVTAVTLLSLPGKVNAMALERRACLLVKPRIQEEQWRFHPGCRTLYKLFKLLNIFGGRWEFAQWVYVFFADLEKAFSCIPWSALWGPSGP